MLAKSTRTIIHYKDFMLGNGIVGVHILTGEEGGREWAWDNNLQ